MEVRQQAVDDRELGRRMEENPGRARPGHQRTGGGPSDALQDTHAGSPDGDDPTPLGLGAVDGFGRAGGQVEPLFMHPVVFHLVRLHRRKRAVAHMERDKVRLDAGSAKTGQQSVREMQSRRRGSHRAVVLGENRLVARAVFQADGRGGTEDVGRQGHLTEIRNCRGDIRDAAETEQAVAFAVFLQDLGLERRHLTVR